MARHCQASTLEADFPLIRLIPLLNRIFRLSHLLQRLMIQQIRIQNFRSLKDVTLDLQQVNLLIGPNNSGKTNLLKALNFLGKFLADDKFEVSENEYKSIYFQKEWDDDIAWLLDPIVFSVVFSFGQEYYFYRVSFQQPNSFVGLTGVLVKEDIDIQDAIFYKKDIDESLRLYFKEVYSFSEIGLVDGNGELTELKDYANLPIYFYSYIKSLFTNVMIYKPDPAKFFSPAPVVYNTILYFDAHNIVPFLFSLSQNYKKRFRKLEDDLKRCVGDIVSISTPPDPAENGKLKLKFFDANDNDYWADEVSEGVLYFLALLCIIHQPKPPRLLLLEEPEKGIHPRRIREVLDFIFDLSQEKNIQVILTTHDTYVVDQFADIPEAVFVFDKKDGATEVKNLQKDIIEPANQLNEKNGLPPTHYTQSLGEHWAAGFLGGVPR